MPRSPFSRPAASRRWLPFLLLPLLLAGCLRYEARPLDQAEVMDRIESRSLSDPGLAAYMEKQSPGSAQSWPRQSWDLPALTLAAFYFHPALDVARAQWAVAEAGVISAGARPNPTLGIAPEFSFDPESGISPWIAGFSFDIPIETAGKRGYRVDAARHLSEAARLNIGIVAWDVFSNLRDNLVALAAATRRVELLRAREEIQQEMLKLLERRLAAGEIAPHELAGASMELTRTRLQMQEAERELIGSRTAVAAAIGVPAEALAGVLLEYDLDPLPSAAVSERDARREALHNRTDVAAALAEYAASQSALQLEIAKQYPDVHIGSGYEYDQGQDKWTFGIAVELPVFNRNEGGIAVADARRAESAARFMELQAGIVAAIDAAVAQQQLALEQAASAAELLATQERQFDFARRQFEAGDIDRLEFLDARLALAGAGSARLDALHRVHEAEGDLEDAMRRPLNPSAWMEIRSE